MKTDAENQQKLYRVVTYSTALAFGAMVASLEALRPSSTGFSFDVSFKTLIAFLLGGAVAFPFWRFIFNRSNLSGRKLTSVWIGFLTVLVLLGIGAFLYPLRFVPRDKLPEITTGLITAVCALSGVALLLWGVKKFIDVDESQTERHDESTPRKKHP